MRASVLVSAMAIAIAAACGDDRTSQPPFAPAPTSPTPPPPRTRPAAMTLVSGDNQQGKAGENLEEPFVVRVTDAGGKPVEHAEVVLTVTSGAGVFAWNRDTGAPVVSVPTLSDSSGLASATFRPTAIGRSVVTAQLPGQSTSVTFTADATVMVIEFWLSWNIGFLAPCLCSSDVVVTVGTPVEWKNLEEDATHTTTYTVTATSWPAGARAFDSGTLTPRDRFRFVPEVAGTWEYHDRFSGHTGTLTAK